MSDYTIINGELRSVTSNTNSLQHWKYIKRERKGSKWIYTYPEDEAKRDYKKGLSPIADWLGVDEKRAYENANYYKQHAKKEYDFERKAWETETNYNYDKYGRRRASTTDMVKARDSYWTAEKIYNETLAKYKKNSFR